MKCKNCHRENLHAGRYCEYCGRKTGFSKKKYDVRTAFQNLTLGKTASHLEDGAGEDRIAPKILRIPEPSKAPRVIAIVLAFLLLLAGSGFGLYRMGFFPWLEPLPEDVEMGSYFQYIDGSFSEQTVDSGQTALTALNDAGETIGMVNAAEELAEISVTTLGTDTFYRFSQRYQGIPVYGRQVVLWVDESGKPAGMTSNFAAISSLNTRTRFRQKSMMKKATHYIETNLGFAEDYRTELPEKVIYNLDNSYPRMAWMVKVSGTKQGEGYQEYELIFEDRTGTLLFQNDCVYHTELQAEGQNGPVTVNGTPDTKKKTVIFTDETRHISVKNPAGSLTNLKEIEINETDNLPTAADALNSVSKAYDFYHQCLQRDSYDGHGGEVTVVTNVPNSYGIYDEAAAYQDTVIFYPNQAQVFESSIAPDIAGHEYTHLVMNDVMEAKQTARGSIISEAYADIMGNLIESRAESGADLLWEVGEDTGSSRYSMANPSEAGYAASFDEYDESKGAEYNAPILGHAAYLMWTGGPAGSLTPEQTAIRDAAVLGRLWYTSMLMMPNDASLEECRKVVELAARRLYLAGNINAMQLNGIRAAFDQVHIPETLEHYMVGENPLFHIYDKNHALYAGYHVEAYDTKQEESAWSGDCTDAEAFQVPLQEGDYRITVTDLTAPDACETYVFVLRVRKKSGDSKRDFVLETSYERVSYTDIALGSPITLDGVLESVGTGYVLALDAPLDFRFTNAESGATDIFRTVQKIPLQPAEGADFTASIGTHVTANGVILVPVTMSNVTLSAGEPTAE